MNYHLLPITLSGNSPSKILVTVYFDDIEAEIISQQRRFKYWRVARNFYQGKTLLITAKSLVDESTHCFSVPDGICVYQWKHHLEDELDQLSMALKFLTPARGEANAA